MMVISGERAGMKSAWVGMRDMLAGGEGESTLMYGT